MNNCCLAIDIGASSGRHIVGWMEEGELKTVEVYRFKNQIDERDGRLYWNVERLFEEILAGLKNAGQLGYRPEVVGIDTWAVDYALLDKEGRRVGEVFAYRDRRGGEASKRVHALLPFEKLYEKTGIQYQPFNTIYQLYDDKLTGRLDGAARMLMLPDYFGWLLTGKQAQEYTNATSTGMVDPVTRTWDDGILSALGLDRGLFLAPSMPGTVLGSFTDEIARRVGYGAVVALPPTHDTASAVEAIDVGLGVPYISSGTWSLLGVKSANAKTDARSRAGNWSNEGGPGYFRYQKNIMGMWLIQSLKSELCHEKSFEMIALEAQNSDFDGVCDVNHARFLAPKSMKDAFDEAFANEKRRPKSSADYFRAAYLGLAHCYKRTLEELYENTDARQTELYIVGGGAKNRFLNDLTARVCGVRVIALPIEATAIGNLKHLIKVCESRESERERHE